MAKGVVPVCLTVNAPALSATMSPYAELTIVYGSGSGPEYSAFRSLATGDDLAFDRARDVEVHVALDVQDVAGFGIGYERPFAGAVGILRGVWHGHARRGGLPFDPAQRFSWVRRC